MQQLVMVKQLQSRWTIITIIAAHQSDGRRYWRVAII